MKSYSFNSQSDYNTITIIRTIAVILVVFIQHSLGSYGNSWNYIDNIPSHIKMLYGIISTIFNNISMPLLILISGYLYQSLYKEKKQIQNLLKINFYKD